MKIFENKLRRPVNALSVYLYFSQNKALLYPPLCHMKNILAILCIASSVLVHAQDIRLQGAWGELIAPPMDAQQRNAWLDTITRWRTLQKQKINYTDTGYKRPELSWTKKTFMYVQMMAHDRYFYDPVSRKYTVDRYLRDLTKRYGGIDAVLIWPTYPNIGADNRNQFDLVAAMPGGKEGIRQMIQAFHRRGVKVFFPIMIWDRGTRPIDEAMAFALIKEMKELGADGMNGDTMNGVTEDFRKACDSLHYPIALQPEINLSDLKMLQWNTMSWGYYWLTWDTLRFGYTPAVSLYKWMEPKHQVSLTDRWAIDKTDDLQYAFFNGIGYNTWENVWGIWNEIPERFAETIRRIRTIYQQFPDAWSSDAWEPHIPVLQNGVFASGFPEGKAIVYTFVNRDSGNKNGAQITLENKPSSHYYDLWNGVEIIPVAKNNEATLSFSIEGNGFGAILVTEEKKEDAPFLSFLQQMKRFAKQPLAVYSTSWKPLQQSITAITSTMPALHNPDGMLLIPEAKNYVFKSEGVMIEGNSLPDAVGVQYPWQTHAQRSQTHTMNIPSFYVDEYPVTNKQFKQFLVAAKYHPKDDYNFLKDWRNGNYPTGWDDKPVTWVSPEDAQAYAAWAGKRLPHEWEWQYAAQGTDGRTYPWGSQYDSTKLLPADTARMMREPTAVTLFSKSASPFGVQDMVGNVWQWTDEYSDEHTRAAIVKGGSYYHAQTSGWYFPQAQEVYKYGKYLLMSPGMDRAGTIGFRCVKDGK